VAACTGTLWRLRVRRRPCEHEHTRVQAATGALADASLRLPRTLHVLPASRAPSAAGWNFPLNFLRKILQATFLELDPEELLAGLRAGGQLLKLTYGKLSIRRTAWKFVQLVGASK
jgi:hypothetical protein